MIPENIAEPIIDVKHSELERLCDESIYKSLCPKCGGLLLVYRDQDTLELEELDVCVKCGQHYRYTDIEEMNNG